MSQITVTFTNAIATFGLTNGASSNYATAHGGNTPSNFNDNDVANGGVRNNYDGSNYGFDRNFFHFDISSIPANATIVSAFFRLPGTNTSNNNVDSDTIGIYQSTVSTNTSVASGDWTNFGATLLGSLAMASYNNAGNNDMALNSSGLALLQAAIGGYAKLMLMTTKDHGATQPTGKNNQTFTTTGLLLSVTYSIPDILSGDFKFL